MNTYAIDFETFYNKTVSVSVFGPRAYFAHPEFDAYLLTVVGDDGFQFAGNPKDFDWERLRGNTVVMHNASFDFALYRYGVEQGWYPDVPFTDQCSADLAAYLGIPRSLKEASAVVLGVEVDKGTREAMLNRRWETMTPEFRDQVVTYALADAALCLQLWQKLSPLWPERERSISRTNRKIGMRGVPMDAPAIATGMVAMKTRLFDAEASIPWIENKTPLSRSAINDECRKNGIEPPSSWAKDSEEAEKWFATHGAKFLWAKAVQSYRSVNAQIRKLEAFDRGTLADGRYYGGFMYFGANPTGRFSGSGGNLNLQNLPREEMHGVELRKLIRAGKGKKLVVVDLSQIEVRTLCYLAEDTKTLDLIRDTPDIYHTFAIILGMHKEEDGPLRNNPALRKRVKAITLGCGYGMGFDRFAATNEVDIKEAEESVDIYRKRMSKVVNYWKTLDRDMGTAFALGAPFVTSIPSGRTFSYGVLKRMRSKKTGKFQYLAKLSRFGKMRDIPIYGAHCAEHCSQGLARDVFSDMMVRVEEAGFPVVMHVHDELVCEVDGDKAESALADILRIMRTPPTWIPGLPVDAEGTIMEQYSK